MVSSNNDVLSGKLANGDRVFKNDHVYISPPWSERDGTPYIVARIIEFLPPNSTPKKGGSKRGSTNEIYVRVCLYYRPSDVSGRNVSDFRLLMAVIHTDVQPLSNVRGKCYVRHRDRIEDLIKWKRLPDHFYFVKYYDPYIKREFEVIRTESVNNIPLHVREVMLSRYEYLVTEREMIADLTDDFRTCCICDKWAASQDSVRCEACKKHYHMACLNPPLQGKPAKGYSWVCLPCSLQRRRDVEDQKFHYAANGSAPSRLSKPSVKVKEKSTAFSTRPDVMHRGWSWRYFGLYTNAEETLDSDDPIFPRTATRTGVKHQANVLSWEEQQEKELRHQWGEPEAGPSRHIGLERGHDPDDRKFEPTIKLVSAPSDDLASFMDEVSRMQLPVPAYDTERLNMAVAVYESGGREAASTHMKQRRWRDFNPIVFSDAETLIFEESLETYGGLDAYETAKKLGKRPAEVLRFSYIWKNRKLKTENESLRQHLKVNTAHARQNKTLGALSLGMSRGRGGSEASDDEVSLYSVDGPKANKMQCAACSTKISSVWWRCPRTIHGSAMCESCGSNYRKYGVISFVKAEESKKPEKKDVMIKKGKDEQSGASTPIPPAPPKLPPCVCCRRMEPKALMARCKTCTFSVHAGCYGIPSQDMTAEWECELCMNARLAENYLQPHCALCPRDLSAMIAKNRRKTANDFDLLSALKPTEGRRWAHILCSAWMQGIQFTNPATFKPVEGIYSLPRERWDSTCSLCLQKGGAVISCSECSGVFHASCAWISGYRFGFEFSLAKPGKREQPTITKFKEEMGVMNASCWCRAHDLEGRQIHDMHEIDPEQNETALQVYISAYKTLPPHDESFALLRKANRIELLLPVSPPVKVDAKICARCAVDVSPMWHEMEVETTVEDDRMDVDGEEKSCGALPAAGKKTVCHQCYFSLR